LKIINLEPHLYSRTAIKKWVNAGINYFESSWNEIYELSGLEDVDTIIVRLEKFISRKELSLFPNLKYLITATTGLTHLDLKEIKSQNIQLYTLKGHDDFLSNIPSTAEMTWALIMSLLRQLPQANIDVRNGHWNRDKFLGIQLKDKNIGIVGLGRTGQLVAKYAVAFGFNVYFYDPYQSNIDNYIKCKTLCELFLISDIVTFHVHLKEDTKQMLNKENVHYLKAGCFLINTSRGEVWDENIVCDALKNNKIAGVATDVLTAEFDDIKRSPIWQLQRHYNIIITPHIGGATIDAMRSTEEYIADYFINNYSK
jgi:D-3-phosphoglycerate dehydrogenase / 2-oxoglutarate reductase